MRHQTAANDTFNDWDKLIDEPRQSETESKTKLIRINHVLLQCLDYEVCWIDVQIVCRKI